jgi:phosphatidylglycerol:prolipoprotein diacylglycerol transferase
MVLYGSGRFWIEGLRTDQLLIPGTELPVSQVLSGVLVVTAASVLIIKIYLYKRKTRLSIVEKV